MTLVLLVARWRARWHRWQGHRVAERTEEHPHRVTEIECVTCQRYLYIEGQKGWWE